MAKWCLHGAGKADASNILTRLLLIKVGFKALPQVRLTQIGRVVVVLQLAQHASS